MNFMNTILGRERRIEYHALSIDDQVLPFLPVVSIVVSVFVLFCWLSGNRMSQVAVAVHPIVQKDYVRF